MTRSELAAAYARAWEEWEAGLDAELWESTSADGLSNGGGGNG